MRKSILSLISFIGLALPASAADLTVQVVDQAGAPVENAVVSLSPKFDMTTMPAVSTKAEMRQQGTVFVPFVLPVSVGTTVSFPNFDEFRHQVYSFSKPKRFELRLYGQDESKTIQFDQPGAVALGCNIHDNMLAYIYVSDAPIVVKTDSSGAATLTGLEAGEYKVSYWHPDLSSTPDGAVQEIAVADDNNSPLNARLDLRSIRSVQSAPSDEEYN